MCGKHHFLFGTLAGISVLTAINLGYNETNIMEDIGFLGVTILSSLLPDIDLPNSKLGQKLPLFSKIINKVFGHRGFLHSPLCGILFIFLLYKNVNVFWTLPFTLGFFGHLLCDMCTVGGVPLFYPFSRKRYRIFKLKSGSKIELIIIFVIIFLLNFILYYFI